MQVVRSCKMQDGCEVDVRFSVYLSYSEMKVITDLFGLVFSPTFYSRDGIDVKEIKSRFTENDQLLGYRMFNSLFRSI